MLISTLTQNRTVPQNYRFDQPFDQRRRDADCEICFWVARKCKISKSKSYQSLTLCPAVCFDLLKIKLCSVRGVRLRIRSLRNVSYNNTQNIYNSRTFLKQLQHLQQLQQQNQPSFRVCLHRRSSKLWRTFNIIATARRRQTEQQQRRSQHSSS